MWRERNSDDKSIKTQLTDIRFKTKHEGDTTKINIPGYDVDNVTKWRSTTKYLYPIMVVVRIVIGVCIISGYNYYSDPGYWRRVRSH